MTRFPLLLTALLAGLLAAGGARATPTGAIAATHPPTSPDQPRPRTGAYRIVSQGEKMIHAKCAEGGNVVVPVHPAKPLRGGAIPSRDAAIRDACKTIDYTK